MTRLRQSSASSFAARLVEPTRSQNITVIGRRSAAVRDHERWGLRRGTAALAVACATNAAIASSSRLPIAESGDADVLEPGVRQLRQQVGIDLVVAKCGLVLTESEAS